MMGKQVKSLDVESLQGLKNFVDENNIGIVSFNKVGGGVTSCPFFIQSLELDGHLWFFVRKKGFVARAISYFPQVCIHTQDRDRHNFLSMEGLASIEDDRLRAYEYWTPIFRSWFPEGLDDPNLGLMKVEVQQARFWGFNHQPISLQTAIVSTATGEPHDLEYEVLYSAQR